MRYKNLLPVLNYYLCLLKGQMGSVCVVSILGLLSRVLSILTFALVIKIFLSMFDQQASLAIINSVLKTLSISAIDMDLLSYYLLLPLAIFVVLQVITGKLYLLLLKTTRRSILQKALLEESESSPPEKASLCYDYLMHGFEALIKSLEIVLFYCILLIFIFVVNLVMGVTVIVLVPLLVTLLVYRDRKEAFVQDAIRHDRNHIDGSNESLLRPIHSYDQQLSYRINGTIAADFLGGIALIVIFLIYVEFHQQFSVYGLIPLLLIFAIRFAVLYAGELSRQLGVVLRIRTVIS